MCRKCSVSIFFLCSLLLCAIISRGSGTAKNQHFAQFPPQTYRRYKIHHLAVNIKGRKLPQEVWTSLSLLVVSLIGDPQSNNQLSVLWLAFQNVLTSVFFFTLFIPLPVFSNAGIRPHVFHVFYSLKNKLIIAHYLL